MALKKCENCGVFFGAEGNEVLCENCTRPKAKKTVLTGDIEHDKFVNARAVVYDQPNVTPEELVNELKARGVEITIGEIMKFVTDGRLSLITIDGGTYCSSCGRKIALGTMCKDCSKKLDKFRKTVVVKPVQQEKKNTGMHTKK